ncbi:MAG: hypothetical protein ACRD2X_15190, partial [Vicinamibacteraceae bacterium]
NLHNAYNINRFTGDLLDDRFDGHNPSFSTINMVTSTSSSDYHGATIQVKRPFQQGFMLQGAYTFGKAMNDSDAAVGVTNYQDAANRDQDRAPAGYDVRHRLALVGLWELPFFSNSSGLVRQVLGGWQLSGFAIFQTGTPMTVVNNAAFPQGDFNADGNSGDRPNTPDESVEHSGWTRSEYLEGIFQVEDFPIPAAGTNGNLGRNTFRGPRFAELSFSLAKRFPVTARLSAEFRLDAFNALNRVNLNNPVMDLSSNDFGRTTSQLPPRTLQAGIRLRF